MPDKVLVIESRFYEEISDKLLDGAKAALRREGATYDIVTVPGALEIPAALKFAIDRGGYDAYVVLGCVIRGETSHYDIVCNESARGVYDLVLSHGLALGNGILTVEDDHQAMARADAAQKNKGGEAAKAAMRMLDLKRQMAV